MNLDKRIITQLDILSCFDIEKAKSFIGQKGYFANDLYCFSVLEICYYHTLVEIKDGDTPFKDDDGCYWNLFIPEYFLKSKPKEKQYRPFKNTKEFFIKTNFEAGDVIHIRSKNKIEYWLMLVGWTNNGLRLGTDNFSFENLFENFELWDGEENFIPFGVLEE